MVLKVREEEETRGEREETSRKTGEKRER